MVAEVHLAQSSEQSKCRHPEPAAGIQHSQSSAKQIRKVKTILGSHRRQKFHWRKNNSAQWEVAVEKPAYDLTIFKVHCSGLRAIVALFVLRSKAIKPLLVAARRRRKSRGAQSPRPIDRHYETIRLAMLGVFDELGLAA
jgi:hypothetical protein